MKVTVKKIFEKRRCNKSCSTEVSKCVNKIIVCQDFKACALCQMTCVVVHVHF